MWAAAYAAASSPKRISLSLACAAGFGRSSSSHERVIRGSVLSLRFFRSHWPAAAACAGTVLSTLATYSNLNAASGYALRSLNLSAYAGQTVTVRFTGTEGSTLQTSFVLDDTALNVS